MDPISQGVLGAVVASSASTKDNIRQSVLIGWGAGMLADADVFIRSESDPLLTIEFHRQFTHSLFFIPFGALIATAFFWLFLRKRMDFGEIYRFALLGYATSGLLDACTSYGTQLLWPFSDLRVSWNIISIIDPVYTIPLFGLALGGALRRKPLFGQVGLVFAILYPLFGVMQNQRASEAQANLISRRGHAEGAEMQTVKPSMANLALWRSIYRIGDAFYVDAIRVGYWGGVKIFEGKRIDVVSAEDLVKATPPGSAIREDIERFNHFSDQYLVWHPEKNDMLCDLRYAFLPNSVLPLWGIKLVYEEPDTHSEFVNFRELDEETRSSFANMLWDSGIDDTN